MTLQTEQPQGETAEDAENMYVALLKPLFFKRPGVIGNV